MGKYIKAFCFFAACSVIGICQQRVEAAPTPIDKLSINGDLRYTYMDCKFKTGMGTLKKYIKEQDIKLSASYSFDKSTKLDVGICDFRVFNDASYNRRGYIYRANLTGDNKKYGYTAGRMGHVELDNNVLYADYNYLDGVKLRLGPKNANVELFGGTLGRKQDRQRGYYVKGVKEWKHWSAKTALFNFDKAENLSSWNHQKLWENSIAYKFDNKVMLKYERLNFAGQNYGQRASSQSGYVATLIWDRMNITKPNTFYTYLAYYHQPQGTFLPKHHSILAPVDMFDATGTPYGAMGFKGPGVYVGYTLAKGVLLSLEAYRFKNLYGPKNALKHELLGAYIDVFF